MEFKYLSPSFSQNSTKIVDNTESRRNFERLLVRDSGTFINEENALLYGFAFCVLENSLYKSITRAKLLSVRKWKQRIFKLIGLPGYYLYVITEPQRKFYQKVENFGLVLKNAYIRQQSQVFLMLSEYTQNLIKNSIKTGIFVIIDKILLRERTGFNKIKRFFSQKKFQKRNLKERIFWALMVLKNSKSFGIKKTFRKWQKWAHQMICLAKVNIFVQINRYKVIFIQNYEKSLVFKVIRAYMDSQAKKQCNCFLKWKTNAKNLTQKEKIAKEEVEKTKKTKENQEKLNELENTLLIQKKAIIFNQIESILYNVGIDTMNGFIHL